MESFLNRYRNITVLLLVICAQLVLLAVQVKNDQNVRMIRVWTVTAVMPAARVLEGLRGGGIGFLRNYILLHDTNEENKRLQADLDRLKIENNFLKTQLTTADRAKALAIFQAHTASKTLAATIIGTGAASNSKMVFIDRGSSSGVQRGMAVVTPDGIVGKIISAYPAASEVLLITDPDFAAGVVSQKSQVRGTLKGQGSPLCKVDYVPIEEKIEVGEFIYTSGDDRVFPKGFPVGIVKVVRNAHPFKEILVEPAGLQRGLEDVLILLDGVHQAIPEAPPVSTPVYMTQPPPAEAVPAQVPAQPATTNTEADKIRQRYKALGDSQSHKFGENPPGARAVDFNAKPPAPVPTGAPGAVHTQAPGGAPAPTGAPAEAAPAGSVPNHKAGPGPSTKQGAVPPPVKTAAVKTATVKPATARPDAAGAAAGKQAPRVPRSAAPTVPKPKPANPPVSTDPL
jgi:rod shape-determining protein MreC